MMNKKGYIKPIPKILNFIMSIVVLATGGLPLLVQYEIIGEIPAIPLLVMEIVTAIAGFLLLLDGFIGSGDGTQLMPRALNLIVGIIVLAGGVVLLLSRFEVIGALPEVPDLVLKSLLIVGGTVLFLDGLLGAKNTRY